MAFIAQNNTEQATSNPAFEKAAGFINIVIPTKSGGHKKLGSIPLKLSNPVHKRICERLSAGTDADLQELIGLLEFNFVEVGKESPEDAINF